MTTYSNKDDRTALGIEHDEHGCTILAITPPVAGGENREAYVYGIPRAQLPSVLFDMTGDAATQAEQEAAEEFLNGAIANGATTEDLISSVRNTILALAMHEDAFVSAEVVEATDEYETMDPDELRREVRNLSAENHNLLNGREALLNKVNALGREVGQMRAVLTSISQGIAKVVSEGAENA